MQSSRRSAARRGSSVRVPRQSSTRGAAASRHSRHVLRLLAWTCMRGRAVFPRGTCRCVRAAHTRCRSVSGCRRRSLDRLIHRGRGRIPRNAYAAIRKSSPSRRPEASSVSRISSRAPRTPTPDTMKDRSIGGRFAGATTGRPSERCPMRSGSMSMKPAIQTPCSASASKRRRVMRPAPQSQSVRRYPRRARSIARCLQRSREVASIE